jgi:hypothetical protein
MGKHTEALADASKAAEYAQDALRDMERRQ